MNQTITEEKRSKAYIAVPLAIFILTVLTAAGFSYLYGKPISDILRNSILTVVGSGTVIFLMAYARMKESYAYDNQEHLTRFLLFYIGCLAAACISPLLPGTGWPFVAVFVILSVFSNPFIGIAAGSNLLMMAVLLGSADVSIFILYFVCGMVSVTLVSDMDESYKIGLPVTISMFVYFVCQTATVVIYANEHWNYELFIIPLISLLVNAIIICIVLKYFIYAVIHRDKLRYLAVNDQEYTLLIELKKVSSKEYYRAVHTVHFCELIADRLGLDIQAAKAGGYYHRIGLLKGENSYDNIRAVYEEHAFPQKACQVLKEYADAKTPLLSKESAVLYMSDKIISTVMKLFETGQTPVDYNKLIDAIFETNMKKGLFNRCSLTMAEFTQMKEIFKKEQLYYDFLR